MLQISAKSLASIIKFKNIASDELGKWKNTRSLYILILYSY